MNSDFSELMQAFENNEVEYLVVGGYAVMAYAEPRFSKDFDAWVCGGGAGYPPRTSAFPLKRLSLCRPSSPD
jgi:hypothetical protein